MPLNATIPTGTRLHTPELWNNSQYENYLSSLLGGRNHFTDFLLFPRANALSTADIDVACGQWNVFADRAAGPAGANVSGVSTVTTGAISIGALGTPADNDACTMMLGTTSGYMFSQTAANARRLYMEFRFRVNTIANDIAGFFLGLAGPATYGATAGLLAANADDVADSVSCFGLLRPANDGDAWDLIYQDASQTSPTVVLADAIVPVADTWYKFGFLFDPDADTASRIKFWIDGSRSSTVVSATSMAAAAFPLDVALCPTIAYKSGSTTTAAMQVDWIHALQDPE